MSRTATCLCTPVGKESLDAGTNALTVSVTFDPGCPICAACTCTPAQLGSCEDDKWKVYILQNASCPFCYPDPPDMLLFQDEQMDDEICPFCGTTDYMCDCLVDCFVDSGAGIEQGEKHRMRNLGRRFMNKFRVLRRDSERGIRRAISRRLVAGILGKS